MLAENGFFADATSTTVTAAKLLAANGFLVDSTSATVTAAKLLAANNYPADSTSVTVTAAKLLAANGYNADASSTTISAQNILDENNYTTSDISLINLELLLDNAINYVNLTANTSVASMTGTAGSKTCTCTKTQAAAVKAAAVLMLRAYKDRGPNTGIGGLSVSATVSDPQYALYSEAVKLGVAKLQVLSATNVEYLIDDAIGYLNAQANLGLSLMSGSAGSKSASLTGGQASIVNMLAGLLLRVNLSRGPTSIAVAVSDPEYSFIIEAVKTGAAKLQALSATNVEYIIDDAIGYVNMHTNLGLALMSGNAGSKSAALTGSQATVVNMLAGLLLRVNLSRGPTSAVVAVSDPEYTAVAKAIETSIAKLQTLSATNVEYIIDDAISYVSANSNLGLTLMSGNAGSKTVTLTGSQAAVVNMIAGIILRVNLSRGPTSATVAVSDPEHTTVAEAIKQSITNLRLLSAVNVEYIIGNAVNLTNLNTGLAVAALSGTAGSKSLTATDTEAAVVKLISGYMLCDAVKSSTLFSDNYAVVQQLWAKLKVADAAGSPPIFIANEPIS